MTVCVQTFSSCFHFKFLSFFYLDRWLDFLDEVDVQERHLALVRNAGDAIVHDDVAPPPTGSAHRFGLVEPDAVGGLPASQWISLTTPHAVR